MARMIFQLAGFLGVLIATRLFTTPPDIELVNADSIGCLDLAQYEESFSLRGVQFPEKLRKAIDAGFQTSGQSRSPHHILCWHHPSLPPERQQQALELQQQQLKKLLLQSAPLQPDPQYRIDRAKRLLLAVDAPRMSWPTAEGRAGATIFRMHEFGTDDKPLHVMNLLKPWRLASKYHNKSNWDNFQISELSDWRSFVAMIEQLNLASLGTAIALEEIRTVRWIINWVGVRNPSPDIVVERAKISIDHSDRGLIEVLGGTIDFEKRGQRLTAQVDRLLPLETRWAVIRTNNGRIANEELQKTVDRNPPAFDPKVIWWFTPFAVLLLSLWVVGNTLVRLDRRP